MRRTGLRAAAAIALAAGLSACQSLPGPKPETPDSPKLAAQAAFAAPEGAWPSDRWWEAYGDKELDDLITTALSDSPSMASAQARLAAASAAEAGQRSSLYPALNAGAQVGQAKQSYNYGFPKLFIPKGWQSAPQISLNFSYEIDFWGRNRDAVAAAASAARATEADAAEARLTLSTAIAAGYADLLRLYAERDVAERSLESRRATLDLAARRVAEGLDTEAERSEAAAGVPAAEADIAAIDEDIALERDALAALAGRGPDFGRDLARPSAPAVRAFGLPARLAADLLGRRPDIVAARWRAESAAKSVKVAQKAFLPNVNLAAVIGYESLGLGRLLAAGSDYGQDGAAASLPLFEGGRLVAGLSGARANYAEAVASYDATLVQALREVADAAASERALSARLTASREALAHDEDAYRLAQLRYKGGLANFQSVLLAEDAVLAARRNVVDLEARAFALDVQLIKALGGGYAARG